MRKRKRLLWLLFPSYLVITLVALVAVTIYASGAMRRFYHDHVAADLRSRAALMEPAVVARLGGEKADALNRFVNRVASPSGTRISVILSNGAVMADSEKDPAAMDNHARRTEVSEALAGRTGRAIRYSKTLGQSMMYVAVPVYRGPKVVAVLRTAIAVSTIDAALHRIQGRIALGGLFTAFLAAAVSLYVSRRLSRPIEEIRKAADRFSAGDLTHRLPLPDSEELASLADTMNRMATRLDDRIKTVIGHRKEIEAILSSMIEGVVALDNENRVLRMNRAAADLIGLSFSDAKHRDIQALVRNTKFHALLEKARATGDPVDADLVLHTPAEQILHARCTPLKNADNHRIGILAVFDNVTQLRRLENMRREFAANVSHELKTPLTAIKGFVETLRHGGVESPQESERFLAIIEKHVNRLAAIIEDLMKLSRIEQDQGDIRKITASLRDVLQTAIQVCAGEAEARSVSIELECSGDPPLPMDPLLIEQAVANLIGNAIHFSQAGQKIFIKTEIMDEDLLVQVVDQGPGIPKKHLPRLFERFYRVDKARSRNMGGTGLGLAIVKHIVQAHGGQVGVKSRPGRGSTFTIRLPLS